MYISRPFFDFVYDVQKNLQHDSAGIGVFFNKELNESRNLMSKLARSTLTSPSTTRAHQFCANTFFKVLLKGETFEIGHGRYKKIKNFMPFS